MRDERRNRQWVIGGGGRLRADWYDCGVVALLLASLTASIVCLLNSGAAFTTAFPTTREVAGRILTGEPAACIDAATIAAPAPLPLHRHGC